MSKSVNRIYFSCYKSNKQGYFSSKISIIILDFHSITLESIPSSVAKFAFEKLKSRPWPLAQRSRQDPAKLFLLNNSKFTALQ